MKRRTFIKLVSVSGGLSLCAGVVLAAPKTEPDEAFVPTIWFRLEPAGQVVVLLARTEMGQGVTCSLPMLVAEELEVDFGLISVRTAPLTPEFGRQQTTASQSIASAWVPLRTAAAAAREMLIAAAAEGWQVDPGKCHAHMSVVYGPDSKTLPYTSLLDAASKLPVPQSPRLKSPNDWTIIGRSFERPDIPDKTTGRAIFGMDVQVPGMLYAAILHCPSFGGLLAEYDAKPILAMDGVTAVVPMAESVAVAARSYWIAQKAIASLKVSWRENSVDRFDSANIEALLEAGSRDPDQEVFSRGTSEIAVSRSHPNYSATYFTPFLAHACMEPVNATVEISPSKCHVWAPTQTPTRLRDQVAKKLGLDVAKVELTQTLVGGGFGRKSETDYVLEAVEIARQIGRPVQLIWSRSEDIRHDRYRPACVQRLSATVNDSGLPILWLHDLAVPSVRKWWRPEVPFTGADGISVDGADDLLYDVPDVKVRMRTVETGVPVGILRSIANSYTCFAKESFIDELAHLAKQDPLDYRLKILSRFPRAQKILELAAKHIGWSTLPAGGTARGIALFAEGDPGGPGVFVAHAAEVQRHQDGALLVTKLVCAADCGTTISLDGIRSQIEGGTIFGLSAATKGKISINRGRVQQSNFHDYQVFRMHEVPDIEVHIISSPIEPSGAGEKSVPSVAPAIANAWFALTGERIRRLPLSSS